MARARQLQKQPREFARLALALGIGFDEIEDPTLDDLEERIARAFVRDDDYRQVWEALAYPYCYHRGDDDAWQHVEHFVPADSGPVVVWPDFPCSGALRFGRTDSLRPLLSDAPWSELLVTNDALDYLVIYSDHHVIYGQGAAVELIRGFYGSADTVVVLRE